MNICLISNEYPPETGWGGRGTYIYVLAHGLVELGHNVHVISQAISNERRYYDRDIRIHRVLPKTIRLPLGQRFYRRFFTLLWHLEYSQGVFQELKRILKDTKIDIVESGETRAEGYYIVRSGIVPLVVKLHTPSFLLRKINKDPTSLDRLLLERFEKFVIKKCAAITSCSTSLASILAERYHMPLSRINVIYNPLDTDVFTPGIENDHERTVLYCGRLEVRKGVHTLARAIPIILRKIPMVRFIFIGHNYTAPDQCAVKEQLVEILQANGVLERVEFVNRVERTQLVEYYRNSSICVVPSIWENFPYACLEPMSCGKAVVASRTGGIPEIIQSGVSGLLFNPGDENDLAARVISLLDNPIRLKNIGQNARLRVENYFRRDIIARKTANFYEQVLRKQRMSL